jgi:hypothetical protein
MIHRNNDGIKGKKCLEEELTYFCSLKDCVCEFKINQSFEQKIVCARMECEYKNEVHT